MVVERGNMSIINKMHQDFEKTQSSQPVLGTLPQKNHRKKIVLVCFCLLLILSSIALSYIVFTQKSVVSENMLASEPKAINGNEIQVAEQTNKTLSAKPVVVSTPVNQPAPVKQDENVEINKVDAKEIKMTAAVAAKKIENPKQPPTSKKPGSSTEKALVNKREKLQKQQAKQAPSKEVVSVDNPPTKEEGYLEIKPAQLSSSELASIYLKDADKAEAKGDINLAAKKREQALYIEPQLNEVRKSLALFYHSQGKLNKAQALLQKGAKISPQYSDFNLMLSRMALKAGNEKKAYRYLEQSPPEVKGHLDYYVSYAVLALKLKNYEQAEKNYTELLSQNRQNGRWRMSLAISQDKQEKTELALKNYKQALLADDLSSKAKAYINHRLSYLKQSRGM